MKNFKDFTLSESAKSDRYEAAVADNIDAMEGISAERPRVSSKYADVLLAKDNKKTWLEVKMNHTDNLGNPRVSYVNGQWTAAKPLDPVKRFAIKYLTDSKETQNFLQELANFASIDNWKDMTVPSTKGLLKNKNAVSWEKMQEFMSNRQQYILSVPNTDLGSLVTQHYLEGKAAPAHYMQAADDFYLIGTKNPLGLPKDIPELGKPKQAIGTFKMRISVRSSSSGFYEIQPEIKIAKMPVSKYSVMPGTKKKNPFV